VYNIGRLYNAGELYNIDTLQRAPAWYTHLGHALPVVVDEQLRPLTLLHLAHKIYNHATLGGEDRLTFSLPHLLPLDLTGALLDMAGKIYRVMVVSETEDEQGVRLVEVEAWARWHDLTKMPALPAHEWTDVPAADIVLWLLAGSGWTLGFVATSVRRHLRWSGGCNRIQLLREIEQIFNGELIFDTALRTVSLVPVGGTDKGLFFLRGKNLRRVEIETSTIETVHRLYPRGAQGLTIESVNNGIPFLEVPSVHTPPPSATLEASAFTDAAQLKHYAELVFATMLAPRVHYMCSIVDLSALPEHQEASLNIGDIVTVYDEDAGVHIKTRVVRWKYDVEAPWQSEIELAIPRQDLSNEMQVMQRAIEEVKEAPPVVPLVLVGTAETDGVITVEGVEILTDAGWFMYGPGPTWTGSWSTGWSRVPGTAWSGVGSWDAIQLVPGTTYQLEYTLNMTAGVFSMDFQGHFVDHTSSGTTRAVVGATRTGNFIDFWADAAFNGHVRVSLRPATFAVSPVIIGQTSAGIAALEVRTPPVEGGTFVGLEAGMRVMGASNTALGSRALRNTTSGTFNTALGTDALMSNATGGYNTAVGTNSLRNNASGSENSGVGAGALLSNSTGENNSAVGTDSLRNNTTGWSNSALGRGALRDNTVGGSNSAVGMNALCFNTIGSDNTAVGVHALLGNSTGWQNTAVGASSLGGGTGSNNTALGASALARTNSGSNNTAVGSRALLGGWSAGATSNNTAVGANALTSNDTGTNNTAVGTDALRGSRGFSSGSTAVGADALREYTENIHQPNPLLTAVGSNALRNMTTGTANTAVGADALMHNTTGWHNTAVGAAALGTNTTGSINLAIGTAALHNNTEGSGNLGIGSQSLVNTTTGGGNIGIGPWSLFSNVTGFLNIGIGDMAGHHAEPRNPLDPNAWSSANSQDSIFIGRFAMTELDNQVNQIVIGNNSIGHGSNTATIGNDEVTTTVLSPTIRLRAPRTPASSSSPGQTGEICWDAGFVYVCISPHVWRRTSLAAW